MRIYLFAAIFGCIVLSGLAERDVFQFTDSNGRCWSCSPGAPCLPCQRQSIINFELPPPDISATCDAVPTFDCQIIENRSLFFPAIDPRLFWRCAPATSTTWELVVRDCQCGAYFSYQNQRCDVPWQWIPHCENIMIPVPPVVPCDSPPGETPTVPTEGPTQPPEGTFPPTAPTESPPTVPTEPTIPPPADTTAAPPCNCMPWFPCWCNPCFMMPCGNCNGCQG